MTTIDDECEFEVICGDEYVASAYGPRESAWDEAMHYVTQYSEDGPCVIYEVLRKRVWPETAPF